MPQKPTPADHMVWHKAQWEAALAACQVASDVRYATTAAQLVDMVDDVEGDELYFFRLMLIRLIWWAAGRANTDDAVSDYLATVLGRQAPRPREAVIVAVRDHPLLPQFIQHVTHAPAGVYPTHALMDAATTMLGHVASGGDLASRWRIFADLATDAVTHHVDPDRPDDGGEV